jgi:hypothetical protein
MPFLWESSGADVFVMAMSVERGFDSGRRLEILLEDLLPLVVHQYEMVTALQQVALLLRPQHAHVRLSYLKGIAP